MIHVVVRCTDNSIQEWEEGEDLVAKLESLQGQGFEGRALIDRLLTDDWAAPPLFVTLSGTVRGASISVRIPYD